MPLSAPKDPRRKLNHATDPERLDMLFMALTEPAGEQPGNQVSEEPPAPRRATSYLGVAGSLFSRCRSEDAVGRGVISH